VKASVYFTYQQVEAGALQDHVAVVIDVLRASSTIGAALAAGAQALYPVESTEEAVKLASSLGRAETLLAGERKGLRIEGFDLGNSPREFTPEVVAGKKIVMTTSNGTNALVGATAARRVLVGSMLNLSAVAREVADAPEIAVICSGRYGRFGIDDALCAGMLLARLVEKDGGVELEDSGRAALALAGAFGADAGFLAGTAAGRGLAAIGLAEDVDWCARVDASLLVPELIDRKIVPAGYGQG
jgi:2-phosphosulfolactate phosphatase